MEIQNFEYLENKESFLDEIKNIFHSFCRAIICCGEKKVAKKLRMQVLTSVLLGNVYLTATKTSYQYWWLHYSCMGD